MRDIAISAVSLFPFIIGPSGPEIIKTIATKIGVRLQLVPLIGWRKNDVANFPKNLVLSYEGGWISSFEQLKRKIMAGDSAALLAPFVFGSIGNAEKETLWFREFFPEAIPIDLPWGIEEIASKREKHLEHFLSNHGPFVFDTFHIRERVPDPKICIELFEIFLKKEKIQLIHIQTRSWSEFSDFLNGQETFLDKVLGILRKDNYSEIGIVFEIPPQFLWSNLLATLSRLKTLV
jgi:hypothetical protein